MTSPSSWTDGSPTGCERRYASSSPSSGPTVSRSGFGSGFASYPRSRQVAGEAGLTGDDLEPAAPRGAASSVAAWMARPSPSRPGPGSSGRLSSERRAAAAGRPQQWRGVRHRAAAERASVVGAEVGVTHDEVHSIDRHLELRGDEERECRPVALPDVVDLAGEGGHYTVGLDMEPGARARRPLLGLDGDDEPVGRTENQSRSAGTRSHGRDGRSNDGSSIGADDTSSSSVARRLPERSADTCSSGRRCPPVLRRSLPRPGLAP